MKLLRLLAAAVLLAPVPLVSASNPAGGAEVHHVVAQGNLEVYECCTFLSPSHLKTRHFNKPFVLTHDKPKAHFQVKECVDDQVRGELRVDARINGAEEVVAAARIKLYEESTCENLDLDGQNSRSATVGETQSGRLRFTAVNTEFHSSDSVAADFTVTNNVGAPPEPSHVVARRLPGDSSKIVLDWVDEATNETGYEILNTSTGQIARLGPNRIQTYWKQPIVYRTCFQIRAVGALGSSAWTPVSPTAECA
jgi:hypothetical protein